MNKVLIVVFACYLLSCKNEDVVTTSVDTTITAWLDSAGITATRDDNGIYYYAETSNPTGAQVSTGAVVAIYYTLYDLDNNVIASYQAGNGDSLLFKHGVSAAYPLGLDNGVAYMRVGEVFAFILPPSQAYAALTSGAIADDAAVRLVVEVVGVFDENDLFAQELIDIQSYIDNNSLDDLTINPLDSTEFFPTGVGYKRMTAGSGTLPVANDTIIVDYSGRFLDEAAFDSKAGFEWVYASNSPRELLSGFEFGVSLMQTDERALLFLPSSQAYRESAIAIPQSIVSDLIADDIIPDYVAKVPAYKTLIFDITRVD